jgi:hypothetical protein
VIEFNQTTDQRVSGDSYLCLAKALLLSAVFLCCCGFTKGFIGPHVAKAMYGIMKKGDGIVGATPSEKANYIGSAIPRAHSRLFELLHQPQDSLPYGPASLSRCLSRQALSC